MKPAVGLQRLNALPVADFVAHLAGIFEHSPWIAARAAAARPFASRQELLAALLRVVGEASAAEQLALIRAHPLLGSSGRTAAVLTAASTREQRGAGLEACTAEDFARLDQLNAAYLQRFGMPFILAVRGRDVSAILLSFETRLANDRAAETVNALREIGLIAGFRLPEAVTEPAAAPDPFLHAQGEIP